MVDYEQRVDMHALRERRVARARVAMEAAGLDALLVWKDENVRFLSSLRAQIIQGKSALLNGCLLRADGTMTLFLSGGEIDRARATMPWVEDLRPIPIMEARGLVRGAFEAVVVPALGNLERIGIDQLAFAQVEAFGELAPH